MLAQGHRLHAGDAGDVLPVVLEQLADDEVVAQVDEADRRLALGVQLLAHDAGHRLGLHGLVEPVGEEHIVAAPVHALADPGQVLLQLRAEGNAPVRQLDLLIQKVDGPPAQGDDLIAHEPRQPRQAEDHAGGVVGVPLQNPPDGGLVRTVHRICIHRTLLV